MAWELRASLEAYFDDKTGERIPALYVGTFATDARGYFNALKESARILNIHLSVIGWGYDLKKEKKGWAYLKQKLICEYCKLIHPEDLVLFIDGFDTIFLQPAEVIRKRYLHFKKDSIVFGAETGYYWKAGIHEMMFRNESTKHLPWPDPPMYAQPHHYKMKYLNAGTLIGPAAKLIEILNNTESRNDQEHYSTLFLQGHPNIHTDVSGILFHLWRGSFRMALMSPEKAREIAPYQRPYFTLEEKENIIKNKQNCDGEFVENELTKRGGVYVDTALKSTPCVAHAHCVSNIDDICVKYGLMKKSSSHFTLKFLLNYFWYSMQGHQDHPIVYVALGLATISWPLLLAVPLFFLCALANKFEYTPLGGSLQIVATYAAIISTTACCLLTLLCAYHLRKRSGVPHKKKI